MSINSNRYIHNLTDSEVYYVGVPIPANSAMLIPGEKYVAYANNDGLLSDISNNLAGISVDGINILSTISAQLNTLKGYSGPSDIDGVPLARQRAFSNADNMRFRGTGIIGTPLSNTTTNTDLLMSETRFINGLEFIVRNHVFGDSAKFQVVDVDNVLGYGAGLVLDEFGTDWYVAEDTQRQGPYILPYPALVTAGLYLRIVYNSTGTASDVDLRINYFLHKKVI